MTSTSYFIIKWKRVHKFQETETETEAARERHTSNNLCLLKLPKSNRPWLQLCKEWIEVVLIECHYWSGDDIFRMQVNKISRLENAKEKASSSSTTLVRGKKDNYGEILIDCKHRCDRIWNQINSMRRRVFSFNFILDSMHKHLYVKGGRTLFIAINTIQIRWIIMKLHRLIAFCIWIYLEFVGEMFSTTHMARSL